MTKQYDICLLPGDGIGPEIIAEGVKVLNAVGAKYNTRFDCKESLIGGAAIDAVGDPLPAATLDAAKAADAVLLAAVGGLDLAAMTGVFLGCAQNHVPAVVDGYISIVAALTAVRLCPAAGEYLFLSHASYEIGYRIAAQELGQEPCLLLGMRLGEGSGCPVMFQILRAACAVMDGMATFPEAAIEDDYLAPIRAQDSFTVTP